MYYLATELLQPFVLLYLLMVLLLLGLWRKWREHRRLLLGLTLAFLLLTLCSLPAVNYLALGSLEWSYPPLQQAPEDAQAIVVLAGYIRPADDVRSEPELGEDTLYRCLRAAELYRQGKRRPVVVSGGAVDAAWSGPLIAPHMRDFLVQLGVSSGDVIVEDQSRTTWENAVQTQKLLQPLGIAKVVLVTDAAHLPRAVRCFRKQGLDVTPCGCRYRATSFRASLPAFLPDPAAAGGLLEAWHEWLGLAWYWLHGRI
jgi:uncharacterized SAM-binding protein YcdF (DUF218 family)